MVPGDRPERADPALARRVFRYRGHRVQKAQAGWTVWLGNREVGWGSTKVGAKRFVDEVLAEAPPKD